MVHLTYIGTGKPEMPVGGQKRMLAEKKETQRRTNGLVQFGKNSHASWKQRYIPIVKRQKWQCLMHN